MLEKSTSLAIDLSTLHYIYQHQKQWGIALSKLARSVCTTN